MSLPTPVLQAWQHTSTSTASAVVLPDGCCGLILRAPPGQRPYWFVTPLADAAYGTTRNQTQSWQRSAGHKSLGSHQFCWW